ncbi:hypothetical protein BJ878DRAFT_513001 [Calycina marina]|uniref:Uncharacterized protein n=1 Tax=Calycina marina TaxID=1763456 RepID=A0A9P8CDT2_9HELO|nr:hypothetical protein BJ878DRAFT_513001 [Calycina marina]
MCAPQTMHNIGIRVLVGALSLPLLTSINLEVDKSELPSPNSQISNERKQLNKLFQHIPNYRPPECPLRLQHWQISNYFPIPYKRKHESPQRSLPDFS